MTQWLTQCAPYSPRNTWDQFVNSNSHLRLLFWSLGHRQPHKQVHYRDKVRNLPKDWKNVFSAMESAHNIVYPLFHMKGGFRCSHECSLGLRTLVDTSVINVSSMEAILTDFIMRAKSMFVLAVDSKSADVKIYIKLFYFLFFVR